MTRGLTLSCFFTQKTLESFPVAWTTRFHLACVHCGQYSSLANRGQQQEGPQKISTQTSHMSRSVILTCAPCGSVEDTWLLCHQRYLKETAEVDKHGGWDVLFYGDSIIEEWR